MKENKKVIFHMDFDSYFASAHRTLDSSLLGKPIAIAKSAKRAIAASVSYELKAKGVKAGWPKHKIIEVEPKTIFIEPDFSLYLNLSNRIFDYVAEHYTKNIEVFSIDECWLDVTNKVQNQDPTFLAYQIQNDILNNFKIPLTVGISYNKFLAKLSTNLGKPFGVRVTREEDVSKDIWPLDILDYFGIGAPTANKLREIGINTIGDLANADPYNLKLRDLFRSRTPIVIAEAQGHGNDQLSYEHNDLKTIGNELTFLSQDLDEKADILKIIRKLSEKVALRAQNRTLKGYVITLNMRSTDREWHSKQKHLNVPINDVDSIYNEARKLFNTMWKEDTIRGIGVRLNNLKNEFEISTPVSLFEEVDNSEHAKYKLLVDEVNYKLKKRVVKLGNEFERDKVKEGIQSRYLEEDIHTK